MFIPLFLTEMDQIEVLFWCVMRPQLRIQPMPMFNLNAMNLLSWIKAPEVASIPHQFKLLLCPSNRGPALPTCSGVKPRVTTHTM